MNKVLVGQPAIDYITLGSYNFQFFTKISQEILPILSAQDKSLEAVEGQSLQYGGTFLMDPFDRCPVFLGQGPQRGKIHYLFRVSGYRSDAALRALTSEAISFDYSASRIDVQLTLPSKGVMTADLWKEFNKLQYDREQSRGKRTRKVTMVTDNGNGNTIYIGSRKSTRFIRVYEKQVEDIPLVRLEVELKNASSNKFLKTLLTRGFDRALFNVLYSSITGIVDTPLLDQHRSLIRAYAETGKWSEGREVTSDSTTLLWFAEACVGSADKLLASEDTREGFLACVAELNRIVKRSRSSRTHSRKKIDSLGRKEI